MIPAIPKIPVIPVSRNRQFRLCGNFSTLIPVIPVIDYFSWKQNDMRITQPDYIKLLMEDYNKKRTNNGLSLFLTQSAPARIRQACMHLYQESLDKKDQQLLRKDEQVLKDFFGPAEHGRQFLQLIRSFEIDRFRPLDNYLKGNTDNTDKKNVELLAWLIDFKHRPFVFGKDFILNDEEIDLITDGDQNDLREKSAENHLQNKEGDLGSTFKKSIDEYPGKVYKEPPILNLNLAKTNSSKKNPKRILLIFLILVICIGGIYIIWKEMRIVNPACGYWAGDHYVEVPCNEDSPGRVILPMNREKMQRFRMITRKDTITEWSIGRIYYIKDNNKIKYYTEAGNYPEDINRTLKKLSRYIFEKDSLNRKIPD